MTHPQTDCTLTCNIGFSFNFPSEHSSKSTSKSWRSHRAAVTSTKSKIFFPYLQNVFNPSHGKQGKYSNSEKFPPNCPFFPPQELEIPAFYHQLLNNWRALCNSREKSQNVAGNLGKTRNFSQAFPVFAVDPPRVSHVRLNFPCFPGSHIPHCLPAAAGSWCHCCQQNPWIQLQRVGNFGSHCHVLWMPSTESGRKAAAGWCWIRSAGSAGGIWDSWEFPLGGLGPAREKKKKSGIY